MKNGKKIEAIASLLSAVCLLISVTTAWIMNDSLQSYRFIQVDYLEDNVLMIASNDVEVEFLTFDATVGDYVAKDEIVSLDGMLPNETLPFKLRIYNRSGASQQIAINMIDITASDYKIFDKLYVGLSGGHGYTDSTYIDVVVPKDIFYCFSDATPSRLSPGKYEMPLYSDLVVPPTGKDYVELTGYLWLSREATLDFAEISVLFEHLRILL